MSVIYCVLYRDTSSHVCCNLGFSEEYKTYNGLKQGPLSPVLFSLYINDMYEELGCRLFIDNLNIRLIMCADDILIMASHLAVLQRMVNNLQRYCTWGNLTGNLNKSKVMVYRREGRVKISERWKYAGELVELSTYMYLGVLLTPLLSLNSHCRESVYSS